MSEKRIKERCKREDIAFKVVQGFLKKDCDENTELYYSLQTILDLYKQEKEKNKKIEKINDILFNLNNELNNKIEKDYIHKEKLWEKKIELENKIPFFPFAVPIEQEKLANKCKNAGALGIIIDLLEGE